MNALASFNNEFYVDPTIHTKSLQYMHSSVARFLAYPISLQKTQFTVKSLAAILLSGDELKINTGICCLDPEWRIS